MKRFASLFLTLVILPMAAAAQAPPPAADAPLFGRLRAVERELESQRQKLHIPGMSLVIVQDDRVIYLKGLGERNVERGLPVTPDTLFAIGSTTKAFTGLTVLMSQEAGKLSLTDSPKKYLPYFKLKDAEADAKITIADLLSHRSGLDRTDLIWYTDVLSPRQVIRAIADVSPSAKLGEKFQYQNVMFLVAGQIVGQVNGTTWEDYLRRRVLQPLRMDRTNLTVVEMQSDPDHALGYAWDGERKEYTHLPMREARAIAPAGAINSSARDMAQWLRFLLREGELDGKRLVSPAGFQEFGKERIKMNAASGYGLGWMLRNWNGHPVWEHGGNIDGFNAQVALMPDRKLGFALLTNVSASPLGSRAMETIWTQLVGQPAPTAIASTGPAADPAPEVGKYQIPSGPEVEVRLRGGKLSLQITGQPELALENRGGRRYEVGPPAPPGVTVLFRPAAGDPTRTELVLQQSGNVTVAPRVVAEPPKTAPPITAETLMPKVIEALGGEANLRKHRSLVTRMDLTFDTQGMHGTHERLMLAPNRAVETIVMRAQGKEILRTRDWFDGKQGGTYASLGGSGKKAGRALVDAAVGSDFNPELNWKTLYKTVEVRGITRVGEEDAYEVVKTPEGGSSVTDFISTKTYLLLRRRSGSGASAATETFSDYRPVDGVMLPHRLEQSLAGLGTVKGVLRDARFNTSIKESRFRGR